MDTRSVLPTIYVAAHIRNFILVTLIFPHSNAVHKRCLRNGAPLARLSCFLILPRYRYTKCSFHCHCSRQGDDSFASFIPLCRAMRCVRFNMRFNVRQTRNKFDRSYGYCVRNIHIRQRVSHRCRWGVKRWITSGNRLLFRSQNDQLMFPIAMRCKEQRSTTFITHANNLACMTWHTARCVYQE